MKRRDFTKLLLGLPFIGFLVKNHAQNKEYWGTTLAEKCLISEKDINEAFSKKADFEIITQSPRKREFTL